MMTEWNRQRRRVPLVGVTGSHEGSLPCSALCFAAMHSIESRAVFYCNALNKEAQYFTALHSIYCIALHCKVFYCRAGNFLKAKTNFNKSTT